MRVLIACEYSGVVRDAFIKRGHDAVSCDLLATDKPGPHIKGDVLEVIGEGWDLMIAHPPCTYLCSSGLHWNKRQPGREQKTESALAFVFELINAPIEKIAIENPKGRIGTRYRKADQVLQPYQYGHDASKETFLWLKGLKKIKPTRFVAPRIVWDESGIPKMRWGNQTDSGQNKLPQTEDRWKIRSATYPGIADAMASEWGGE